MSKAIVTPLGYNGLMASWAFSRSSFRTFALNMSTFRCRARSKNQYADFLFFFDAICSGYSCCRFMVSIKTLKSLVSAGLTPEAPDRSRMVRKGRTNFFKLDCRKRIVMTVEGCFLIDLSSIGHSYNFVG